MVFLDQYRVVVVDYERTKYRRWSNETVDNYFWEKEGAPQQWADEDDDTELERVYQEDIALAELCVDEGGPLWDDKRHLGV
jgi:hypothetical protein